MPGFLDRTGLKYGRLTVLCEVSRTNRGRTRWLCKCDCGKECAVNGSDFGANRVTSCGCLRAERTAEANAARTKHGHSVGKKNGKRLVTREYRSWKSMKDRCNLPKAPNYHLYGGRGITVCSQWIGLEGFVNFIHDMGPRPIGHTLDRIDADGNYEPSNCRWATLKKQAQNRRKTPEYMAQMKDNLDRGRRRMWGDPVEREKLLAARRKK